MKRFVVLAVLAAAAMAFAAVAAAAGYTNSGDVQVVHPGFASGGALEETSGGTSGYGAASFAVPAGLTLNGLATLSTDYRLAAGDCGLGSPRFSVAVTNGVTSGHVFFYLGSAPSYTGCSTAWTNSGNLAAPANLVDATQIGGGFYETFADVKSAFGDYTITGVALATDGPGQTVDFDNTTINGDTTTFECTPTGLMRDGIDLTAARLVTTNNVDVSGTVDATGCNIGVYFAPGTTGGSVTADVSGANYYGVVVNAASADVTGSAIHDIGERPLNGTQHGIGVLYTTVAQSGTSTGAAASGTVSDTTISNYQKGGIVVSGSGASASLLNNTVTGQGPVDYIAQNGIQVSSGASALIRGNTITGNWYTPASYVACGLLFFDAAGVKQQANTFSGNEVNLCNAGRGGGNAAG